MEMPEKSPPLWLRLILLCLAWFAVPPAFLARGTHPVHLLTMAWLFPFGLSFLLPESSNLIYVWTFGGWLFYLVLMILALIVRDRFRFFLVFGLLCITLVFNVVSCTSMNIGY